MSNCFISFKQAACTTLKIKRRPKLVKLARVTSGKVNAPASIITLTKTVEFIGVFVKGLTLPNQPVISFSRDNPYRTRELIIIWAIMPLTIAKRPMIVISGKLIFEV
jgi:hypothetical protein